MTRDAEYDEGREGVGGDDGNYGNLGDYDTDDWDNGADDGAHEGILGQGRQQPQRR